MWLTVVGLPCPPYLKPAIQFGIIEPNMRIEVVREDGVLGSSKPSGASLHNELFEVNRDAVEDAVDK